MGPGSRRRCPASSPGANGTRGGLLRRLFFVGPLAVATLVAPIGLAPGLPPLPLGRFCDAQGLLFHRQLRDSRAASQGIPVWASVLSNVRSLRMQAVMATLNALPRCISFSL
jgi:hypothetical protein